MKKLAIIGAGRTAANYAVNARQMGIETHCFAWEKGAIAKKNVDFFYPISIFDKERILEICKDVKIDGVVATTELTIAIAAYIASNLELNGISLQIAEQITDKYRNRLVTSNISGLHHPGYFEVFSENEWKNVNFPFPWILKPTSKGGKRGISVIRDESQIHNAFQYAKNEAGENQKFIVEEFIEGGKEYSVESITYKGIHYIIQVTEKISSGPPHCVELAHHQPAMIDAKMRKQIDEVLGSALTAVGITNGPCHTEIKIKDNKIYLIEFNARPGGDRISYPLTELSTGYPYIKGCISVAIDTFEPIETDLLMKNHAGICFVSKQTMHLYPLFKECEQYSWCYEKHETGFVEKELIHNNGNETDYFIYQSDHIPEELERQMNNR